MLPRIRSVISGARARWDQALEIAPEESPLRAKLKDLNAAL